jgi:hypothetical protein
LRKFGSVGIFVFFVILEIFATLGLGMVSLVGLVIFFFIVHLSADPVLYLCLDINLEQEIKQEGTTGLKRSILLTVSNAAWVISPLALVFLINGNFSKVYLLSGIVLIPLLFIIIFFFKNTKRANEAGASVSAVLRSLVTSGDKARIITANFILNLFYSWMVIYLPILLNQYLGFSWDKIGYLFVFMLLPFILFQLPAGYLADRKFGEKEILISGFLIMIAASFAIPSLSVTQSFWLWATVLFASRVGASLVEVACETYFFKHVKEDDTGLISLFRITRPLSYVVAPLLALPIIYLFSYSTSFYFLAGFTALGLLFIPKVDTR